MTQEHRTGDANHQKLRLGVAGPVGAGKSWLIATLGRDLGDDLSLAVVEEGDGLTPPFSAGSVDVLVLVLDISGHDVWQKGDPSFASADLLVLDTTDLSSHLEVDLGQTVTDATDARDGGPVLALSREDQESVEELFAWVRSMHQQHTAGTRTPSDSVPIPPQPSTVDDDGSVPDKQIARWKDDGGAISPSS